MFITVFTKVGQISRFSKYNQIIWCGEI